MATSSPEHDSRVLTYTYKEVDGCSIKLDVYPPSSAPERSDRGSTTASPAVPALIFFHGGGLTVGTTTSWFPAWLMRRVTAAGVAFISADYRLMPPSTGHDILSDIRDLFHFLSSELNPRLHADAAFAIDADTLAVAGCSAGGLCAYLAVMHAIPKPKALLALYAMGGNFLTPHYFAPKHAPFFRGRELLDPSSYSAYLHPACAALPPTAASPLAYHGPAHAVPGFPANPRMLLARLYLQLGAWLDYYTGCHAPSLSAALRAAASGSPTAASADDGADDAAALVACIPPRARALFPQLHAASTPAWPPTFFLHGAADSAVPAPESAHLCALLQRRGVDTVLRVLEDQEHSLDVALGAEALYGAPGGLFDEVAGWVVHRLGR